MQPYIQRDYKDYLFVIYRGINRGMNRGMNRGILLAFLFALVLNF